MSRREAKLTVGELRKELEGLPDDMPVSIEVSTAEGGFFDLDVPTSLDVQPLNSQGGRCFVIEFDDAEEA